MLLEGDIHVLSVLKEKKRLMDIGGNSDHIQPLLVIDGGLMKGVYGVGAALALAEAGYTDVFTSFGGVSSGAATIAYLLSGNGEIGKRVVYEDCCSREFVNFRRFWNILDPTVFENALRGVTGKGLHADVLLAKQKSWYIGLAKHTTGKPELFQPQTAEEIYLALRAAISMPGSTRSKTFLRNIQYSDGASTFPLAVEKMIYDLPATHVLYITNQDKHTKHVPFLENFINNTVFRHRMPRALRVAASMRWESRHALVQKIEEESPKPVLIAWGDASIQSFEQDPVKVAKTIERSKRWWERVLKNT
jgi:predicted patatin/cPLA2 family phospholipase